MVQECSAERLGEVPLDASCGRLDQWPRRPMAVRQRSSQPIPPVYRAPGQPQAARHFPPPRVMWRGSCCPRYARSQLRNGPECPKWAPLIDRGYSGCYTGSRTGTYPVCLESLFRVEWTDGRSWHHYHRARRFRRTGEKPSRAARADPDPACHTAGRVVCHHKPLGERPGPPLVPHLEPTPEAVRGRDPRRHREAGRAHRHCRGPPPALDFTTDPEIVRVVVEGHRLSYGHLCNPAFATEISQIDPLPHQRIAVYDHMLPQPRLRFAWSTMPGAGKTIMTGLYIREMLARRLVRRILVVPPAGLVGNWEREMNVLFSLPFRVVRAAKPKSGNPFIGPGERPDHRQRRHAARQPDVCPAPGTRRRIPYDLVVFDECHKLAADREPDSTSARPTATGWPRLWRASKDSARAGSWTGARSTCSC